MTGVDEQSQFCDFFACTWRPSIGRLDRIGVVGDEVIVEVGILAATTPWRGWASGCKEFRFKAMRRAILKQFGDDPYAE